MENLFRFFDIILIIIKKTDHDKVTRLLCFSSRIGKKNQQAASDKYSVHAY